MTHSTRSLSLAVLFCYTQFLFLSAEDGKGVNRAEAAGFVEMKRRLVCYCDGERNGTEAITIKLFKRVVKHSSAKPLTLISGMH